MIEDPVALTPWRKDSVVHKLRLPPGKSIAFWLAPNIEYYEINPALNPIRTAWARPYPDIQAWSWRDYGNRVGVWRCLEVFDKYGMTGSVSLNSSMCTHLPTLVQEFLDRDWELFCHGQYNTQYLLGKSAQEEQQHIYDACYEIEQFSDKKVRGLLSPALTYTPTTLVSAAACGIDYVLDVCAADSPVILNLPHAELLAVPYSLELNDFFAVVVGGLSAHAYVDRFRLQFDQLLEESQTDPKVIGLPLHPYLIGMPQYIWALEKMLAHVAAHKEVINVRACDVADMTWGQQRRQANIFSEKED